MFLKLADSLCACIATISLLLLALKFVTKRLNIKKLDAFFIRIHKKITYVLVITGSAHGILSLRFLSLMSPTVYLSGLLCLLCILGSVVVFHKRKSFKDKWLLCHSLLGCSAVLILILHVYLFVNNMMNR